MVKFGIRYVERWVVRITTKMVERDPDLYQEELYHESLHRAEALLHLLDKVKVTAEEDDDYIDDDPFA